MKNYIFLAGCVLCLFGAVSCDDLLDTEPKLEVTEEVALGDYSSVKAVLTGVYNNLQGDLYYGRDFIINGDILADNLEVAQINSGRFVSEAANDEGAHISIWGACYGNIARCNSILAAIDNVKDASDEEKANIKGQAYFLRAFAYFDLLRVYSREPNHLVNDFDLGVPVVLDPFSFETSEVYPGRETVTECYTQVEKDLDAAISNLGNGNDFPYFANKVAAKALKARVLLYQEKWLEAATLADEVINESPVGLVAPGSYADAFKQGAESLFELPYASDESLTFNSLQSILMETEATRTGYGDVIPTGGIIDEFAPDGDRITMFHAANKGGQDVMYVTKFNGYGGAFGVDNIALIRLAEVYLISAEAHAESQAEGAEARARGLLNTLRVHRNLPEVDAALEGDDLVEAIMQERRLELAFEGHRFFDLKRKGSDILKDDASENLDWDDYRIVNRIPTSQIDINPNLKQNPGY